MKIRKLQKEDYHIGFMKLINIFTKKSKEISYNEFCNYFDKIMKDNNICIIVIIKNNKIIGTGKIIFDYKFQNNFSCIGHIEDICILEEEQCNGYGKIIIKELIKLSVNNKCYKTILNCNKEYIKFYEKLGFSNKGNEMCLYHKDNFK